MSKTTAILLLCFLFACISNNQTDIVTNQDIEDFHGFWIYGENQHLFQDQTTLKESKLFFINESKQSLDELYLSIAEMEYLPLECVMTGYYDEKIPNEEALVVIDFEILYVEGCEE